MKPKVYFNDKCSICSFEINYYKKKCNAISWSDINNDDNFVKEIKKTKNQVLRRIHVKNNDKILIGVDAFIFIWSKLPYYKILSKLLRLPIIYQFAFVFYEILAFLLFIKNYKQFEK